MFIFSLKFFAKWIHDVLTTDSFCLLYFSDSSQCFSASCYAHSLNHTQSSLSVLQRFVYFATFYEQVSVYSSQFHFLIVMLLVCCNFLLYYKYESYLSTFTRKITPLKIYVTCPSFSTTFFDFSIKEMSEIYDYFCTNLCIKNV